MNNKKSSRGRLFVFPLRTNRKSQMNEAVVGLARSRTARRSVVRPRDPVDPRPLPGRGLDLQPNQSTGSRPVVKWLEGPDETKKALLPHFVFFRFCLCYPCTRPTTVLPRPMKPPAHSPTNDSKPGPHCKTMQDCLDVEPVPRQPVVNSFADSMNQSAFCVGMWAW